MSVPHRNNLFSDAQSRWFVGVWFGVLGFSSLDDFRSKFSEDGMLSMTSVSFSRSSQPASGCRGWLFIALGAARHDKT